MARALSAVAIKRSSSAGGGGGGKETGRKCREDWGVDGGSVDMGVGNGAGHGIVPRVASPEVSLALTSCDPGYLCVCCPVCMNRHVCLNTHVRIKRGFRV